MVRKIKKRIKRTAMPPAPWVVAFDKDNQAAVYIHKHGDGDDHSQCGPVVTCCERASENYRRLAPELHSTVDRLETQSGQHLSSWLDNGVGAMYFALCDPDSDQAIYQFGLPAERARKLLLGQDDRAIYFLDEHHAVVE